MIIAIFTLSGLFIFKDLSNFLLSEAEKKMDIAVYFKKEVVEEEIFLIKSELYKFAEEIESVDYVSQEMAMDLFIEKHQNDPYYLSALEEVGRNPFLASINIKAKDSIFYAQISEFLSEGPYKEMVEKISYNQNERIVNRLYGLTSKIKKLGIIFIILLAVLVLFITFNTVKLTIFAFRDEISTMRLVGASNWFIQGPFFLQGIIYGIASFIITDIFFLIIFYFLGSEMKNWLLGFDLFKYFIGNFLFLFMSQIVFSIILGGFSSYLAVKKYLKS